MEYQEELLEHLREANHTVEELESREAAALDCLHGINEAVEVQINPKPRFQALDLDPVSKQVVLDQI